MLLATLENMEKSPRTWTLRGDTIFDNGIPHEPITLVESGPYVDISEKIEVVEKAPIHAELRELRAQIVAFLKCIDAERKIMLDVIEDLRNPVHTPCGGYTDELLEGAVRDVADALLREHGRLSKEKD